MSTLFPDLFAALGAAFAPHEVKARTQSGRQLHYITARTAMNRLDDVLGPENWWDEYTPHEHSVLCRLTIRLPDGSILTKCDAGGYAGMTDDGDDSKSGYSDAFKRAVVKFGVGRYLYRDGVPAFCGDAPAPAAGPSEPIGLRSTAPAVPRAETGPPREYGDPRTGGQLFAWAKKLSEQHEGIDVVKWLDRWAQRENLPKVWKEWTTPEVQKAHAAAVDALNRHLAAVAGPSEDQE